jgi:hypothetical protein
VRLNLITVTLRELGRGMDQFGAVLLLMGVLPVGLNIIPVP